MKIAFNGFRLSRKKRYGMDTYTIELIKNLALLRANDEIIVFAPGKIDFFLKYKNVRVVTTTSLFYPLWEQILLPFLIKKYDIELFHFTTNTCPLIKVCPYVLTIHDLISFEYKHYYNNKNFYQLFGDIYRRILIRRNAKKASEIITVSNTEKGIIRKRLGHKIAAKTTVIYNGVNKKNIERKKILFNFFFAIGNSHPRKNTETVIKSYCKFLEKIKTNAPNLIIADYKKSSLIKILKKIQKEAFLNKIHTLSYLPNHKMDFYYQHAIAFISLSKRESFSLPIADALANQCRVLAYETNVNRELYMNKITMFNKEHMDEKLPDLLHQLYLKKTMIEPVRIISHWHEAAKKTSHIYNTINKEKEPVYVYSN